MNQDNGTWTEFEVVPWRLPTATVQNQPWCPAPKPGCIWSPHIIFGSPAESVRPNGRECFAYSICLHTARMIKRIILISLAANNLNVKSLLMYVFLRWCSLVITSRNRILSASSLFVSLFLNAQTSGIFRVLVSVSDNVCLTEFLLMTLVLLHYCNFISVPVLCSEIRHTKFLHMHKTHVV
jgi:hypothetical protein